MKMHLRFTITRDDIRRGKRYSCTFCPAALALHRALADRGTGGWNLAVGSNWASFYSSENQNQQVTAVFSEQLKNWIYAFDLGRPVEPIRTRLTFENVSDFDRALQLRSND